jgi:phytoene dehydrogenase-like protein
MQLRASGALVVEADERPGGNARALHDGGYTFDRADHLTKSSKPSTPAAPR